MSNATLNAGHEIEVIYTDGNSEFVLVRQIPVKDYSRGFAIVEDETALVAFLVSGPAPQAPSPPPGAYLGFMPKPWAETLAPQSYERILEVGKEVNARGFFAYCGRQAAAATERLRTQVAALAQLPPDVMKLAMEQGLKSR